MVLRRQVCQGGRAKLHCRGWGHSIGAPHPVYRDFARHMCTPTGKHSVSGAPLAARARRGPRTSLTNYRLNFPKFAGTMVLFCRLTIAIGCVSSPIRCKSTCEGKIPTTGVERASALPLESPRAGQRLAETSELPHPIEYLSPSHLDRIRAGAVKPTQLLRGHVSWTRRWLPRMR